MGQTSLTATQAAYKYTSPHIGVTTHSLPAHSLPILLTYTDLITFKREKREATEGIIVYNCCNISHYWN